MTKSYGAVRALDGVDFELFPQEIHALVGDNGAGKSTLIKVLSGDIQPDSGTVTLDGNPVHFSSPRAAMDAGLETVYQDLALAETLDAADNVFLGREELMPGLLGRLRFLDRGRMRANVGSELKRLGITLKSLTAQVGSLSGGQRQAVAVARAAIWGRRILILDEPVAALGPQQTDQVLSLIQRVRREQGLSVILISHSLPDVFKVADRVSVMRLGRRVHVGKIEEETGESLIGAMTGISGSELREVGI